MRNWAGTGTCVSDLETPPWPGPLSGSLRVQCVCLYISVLRVQSSSGHLCFSWEHDIGCLLLSLLGCLCEMWVFCFCVLSRGTPKHNSSRFPFPFPCLYWQCYRAGTPTLWVLCRSRHGRIWLWLMKPGVHTSLAAGPRVPRRGQDSARCPAAPEACTFHEQNFHILRSLF